MTDCVDSVRNVSAIVAAIHRLTGSCIHRGAVVKIQFRYVRFCSWLARIGLPRFEHFIQRHHFRVRTWCSCGSFRSSRPIL